MQGDKCSDFFCTVLIVVRYQFSNGNSPLFADLSAISMAVSSGEGGAARGNRSACSDVARSMIGLGLGAVVRYAIILVIASSRVSSFCIPWIDSRNAGLHPLHGMQSHQKIPCSFGVPSAATDKYTRFNHAAAQRKNPAHGSASVVLAAELEGKGMQERKLKKIVSRDQTKVIFSRLVWVPFS